MLSFLSARRAGWLIGLWIFAAGCPVPSTQPTTRPAKAPRSLRPSASPGAYEYYLRAVLLEEEERPAEALSALVESLAYDARDPYLNVRAASLALQLGDLSRASFYCARALKLAPLRVDANLTAAEIASAQHDLPEARRLYARLAKLAPNHAAVLLSYGSFLLAQEETKAAEVVLGNLPPESPERKEALRRLATDATRRGESVRAISFYRALVSHSPDDLDALLALGRLYRATGQNEAARALYESPSAPSDEPALWLALAELSLHEKDEARLGLATEHLVALAQHQRETESLYRLVQAHLEADDARGALAVATEALRLTPDDPEGVYWMGRSYAALREWPRAQEQLERARPGLPERAELYYWLAQTYAAQGDTARAKENYQRTLNTTRDEQLRRLAEEALGRL